MNLAALASKIRRMIADGAELIYIPHARKEMTADQINAADVRFALKGCSAVRFESHGQAWRVTCRGRSREGYLIEIVARVFEKDQRIQIVTVYRIK